MKPAAASAPGARSLQIPVRLHSRQFEFVCGGARFSFYVGGVGAGKTYAGAVRAISWAWDHPRSLGVIGAPTYPMLRDATQRTFFELLPAYLIRSFSKTEQRLTLINGSEILFRSLDQPDRTRGMNLGWFWLDEAPLCGHYAWTVLKARLRQAGQETAAWATGTPHGRDGYARDFELEPRPDHQLFRASTRENQMNLPSSFIADLGYTGQFALQEIEGQFVAFDGLVYSLDTVSEAPIGHVRRWRPPVGTPAFDPPGRVVGGVDWGYTNPCAAVVCGLDGDGRAWVLDEFYQRRAGLDETVIPALVKLTRRYGVALWRCDSEDPEAIARLDAALVALGREGSPSGDPISSRAVAVRKGPGSVRAGIQTVTGLMALRGDGTRGLYVDPSCSNTIREFETYAYAYAYAYASGAGGHGRRDASEEPVKQSDHALDALRYALAAEFGQLGHADAYLDALSQQVERQERGEPAGPGERGWLGSSMSEEMTPEQAVFRAYTRVNRRRMRYGYAGD